MHEQPCPDPTRATPPSDELCPPSRQIAHLSADLPGCPAAPGWVVEELFTSESTPTAMTNTCRYIWPGPGDPPPLPPGLAGQTSADCRVSVQSPLEAGLGPSYQDAFLDGVRALPDASLLGVGHPIDVAVVDTAPLDTAAGQAEHGPAIAAIVAALASGCMHGRTCERSVATVLGLPQVVDQGVDLQAGGYFGYQSDLAQGIFAALEGWTNRDHHLVINLSVGWESSVVPGAASAAVEQVIQLARCQGALVVAASGNQPPGSCVDQPTGPGAWEAQQAPDASQCAELGVKLSKPLGARPLVYAATPLDWQQRNLDDFRPGSDARLATQGFVAFVDANSIAYGPISGSSVAAATVSGIAALIWSYFPDRSADEVMDSVYASGTPRTLDQTVVQADFGLVAGSEQHVVTACAALVHACDTLVHAGAHTPTLGQCKAVGLSCASERGDDASTRERTWWAGFDQALAGVPAGQRRDLAAPSLAEQACKHCGASESTWLPTLAALPASAMPDPWVLPQPEKPPCPMCQIKDDDIYLALDPDYLGKVLVNVAVDIFAATGASERRNYGPVQGLSATTLQVLADPELRDVGVTGQPPVSARVTMVFTDAATGRSLTASNQIPVGP